MFIIFFINVLNFYFNLREKDNSKMKNFLQTIENYLKHLENQKFYNSPVKF